MKKSVDNQGNLLESYVKVDYEIFGAINEETHEIGPAVYVEEEEKSVYDLENGKL